LVKVIFNFLVIWRDVMQTDNRDNRVDNNQHGSQSTKEQPEANKQDANASSQGASSYWGLPSALSSVVPTSLFSFFSHDAELDKKIKQLEAEQAERKEESEALTEENQALMETRDGLNQLVGDLEVELRELDEQMRNLNLDSESGQKQQQATPEHNQAEQTNIDQQTVQLSKELAESASRNYVWGDRRTAEERKKDIQETLTRTSSLRTLVANLFKDSYAQQAERQQQNKQAVAEIRQMTKQ
jgi:chromosome segregation ATPase